MNDFLLREEVKREEHLLHDGARRVLRNVRAVFDHVKQRALRLVLKYEVDVRGVLEDLEEPQHVFTLVQSPVNLDFID